MKEKNNNPKMMSFVTKLKEKLVCEYSENHELCGNIGKLYIQGATQDEVAQALLSHECIRSAGITKQVIAQILKDTMDTNIRREIGRERGNANLKHDSETQKEKGKKGGEKKVLPRDKAKEMGKLSHSNKSPAHISKEIYTLREQRGPTTTVEIGENISVPLIGNREDILKILSQHIQYVYNVEKTSTAIRGLIEREASRTKSGKEMFQEISKEDRDTIIKKYLDLQKQGKKTFTENNKEYPTTTRGILSYIKDTFGCERTKQRLFLYVREYQKSQIKT